MIFLRSNYVLFPCFFWYFKYNDKFSLKIFIKFISTEYLSLFLLSFIFFGFSRFIFIFIFLYIYEIGYYFNERSRFASLRYLAYRFWFTLPLFLLMFYIDKSLALFSLFIYLTFMIHNELSENSWPRVITWTTLNIGKLFIVGGVSAIFIFSPIILKRAYIYINNKLKYSPKLLFIIGNIFFCIFILFNYDYYYFLLFIVIIVYSYRKLFWIFLNLSN